MGVARDSSVKEKNLVWKKYRAKDVFKTEYDLERLSFIGSHCLYEQPLVKRYAAGKPLVYLCRTRLTVSEV